MEKRICAPRVGIIEKYLEVMGEMYVQKEPFKASEFCRQLKTTAALPTALIRLNLLKQMEGRKVKWDGPIPTKAMALQVRNLLVEMAATARQEKSKQEEQVQPMLTTEPKAEPTAPGWKEILEMTDALSDKSPEQQELFFKLMDRFKK
jgi:hypothetical protein